MDIPDLADILEKISTPTIWNTLLVQLPKWIVGSIIAIPSTICLVFQFLKERKEKKKQEEEEALAQENEQPEQEVTQPRGVRKRRSGFIPQERSGNNSKKTVRKEECDYTNHVYEKTAVSGGLWIDTDILELIKYVKKYPGGSPDRWEKIASVMNRTVAEVTHMAKKVKEEGLKPGESAEEVPGEDKPKKVKTRSENIVSTAEWSQEQQRALEAALTKYPKDASIDRWEKIAY